MNYDSYLEPDFPDVVYDIALLIENLGGEDMTYYEFYRSIYKHSCGLIIGFLFADDYVNGEPILSWKYCDDIPREKPNDLEAFGVSVSSIVEGADFEVDGDKIVSGFKPDEFWKLCDEVCKEVAFYWDQVNSIYFKISKGDTTEWYQWIDGENRPEGIDCPEDMIGITLEELSEILYDSHKNPVIVNGWTISIEEVPIELY